MKKALTGVAETDVAAARRKMCGLFLGCVRKSSSHPDERDVLRRMKMWGGEFSWDRKERILHL